ncbi:hypothetical protein [Xanthobacter agilis]|uniref:hypothetical protein n=1 Tax=Xanthobacter agilis TaxID=47492 RepID=UPI003726C902
MQQPADNAAGIRAEGPDIFPNRVGIPIAGSVPEPVETMSRRIRAWVLQKKVTASSRGCTNWYEAAKKRTRQCERPGKSRCLRLKTLLARLLRLSSRAAAAGLLALRRVKYPSSIASIGQTP